MANELVVPKLGESISEAVIGKWLKQVGDTIAVDEPVVDLETDKVSVALPSPVSGVLLEQRFQVGATVKVGEVIGSIDPKAVAKAAPVSAEVAPAAPTKSAAAPAPVAAPTAPAPAASKPMSTAGSTTTSNGGASHRTLPPSVRKAIREGEKIAMPTGSVSSTHGGQLNPTIIGDEPEEVVAFSPLRKRIAERLVEAQHTAAILTTFNEVDLTQVMALRTKYQDIFVKEHGVKLGFMSFFIHACVEALKRYPGLNAEVRGTDIVYKKYYHFGIAVGSGRGLVVPVIRHVDQLSFADTEKEILRLADRAKNNQLTLDELSHGTFSITNGGVYGSLLSTPLLNMPQTAILGMHNIVKRAIVIDDQVVARPMMYLAVSYDHRVVDGREAVQFLVNVKERLEAPERLMLGV